MAEATTTTTTTTTDRRPRYFCWACKKVTVHDSDPNYLGWYGDGSGNVYICVDPKHDRSKDHGD